MLKERVVTVVTVCFNAENTIRKTIESVLEQTYDLIEYIIIDGKSNDRTISIAREYITAFEKRKIEYVIISEKDNGTYDAMNKGAALATGQWIIFMNADDRFYDDDVLNSIFLKEENLQFDAIYGKCVSIVNGEEIISLPEDIHKINCYKPFSHQSIFLKTSLQKDYKFNSEYKISADFDLFLRAYRDGRKFKKIDSVVSIFSREGMSCDIKNRSKAFKEDWEIVRKNKCFDITKLSHIRYWASRFKYVLSTYYLKSM